MPESWFELSPTDQAEALEVASGQSGRPAHLLEKDIWVVWTLAAIYDSGLGNDLTFKGGTSLSKVYKVIDRFSEDIDLTYDIRELVPDLLRDGNPIPATASQEKRITSAVRNRLPEWIEKTVRPVLQNALGADGLQAELTVAGDNCDKLLLTYPATKTGTGYSAPVIQLEFGARATGEPHQRHPVVCDISPYIKELGFPSATPLVMAAERTFWEKATAAYVYCLQGRLRGERYSRHWYDLAALAKTTHLEAAVNDYDLAQQVAAHKSIFFSEKDANGAKIDYFKSTTGELQLIPEGLSLSALEKDYAAMLEDGLLAVDQQNFAEIMTSCEAIQHKVNRSMRKN
ncbi:nucleotidyltransferase AbiEii toxin of type IV toxin-antitoxin system [Limnobacter thiooxidans]|uniref:Nucleotidyl transferase AbiEii/AbiGii toxin family protein n=1 Tax=Limnobacter thiooxidans TaxID=131080 RepID=A0AA86MF07_9BURK|nr:nucleotidyltransferase AbiEii toxin of type IV toxin-antitoxin system [Limnobacter thiooxidans]BET27626.1 nucleotidyl transferase AbiEii/AbiGii toxin family protein [Limnobacter thiooxidans]